MSEEPQAAPAPEKAMLPEAILLQKQIKAEVAAQAGSVRGRIIDVMVEEELKNRASILLKALDKRKTLVKEISAFKPSYQRKGNGEKEAVWPEDVFVKKEAAEKKLEKFDKIFDEAIANPSQEVFDKLSKQ